MNGNRPNYKKLYADMICEKYPEKKELFAKLMKKMEHKTSDWIALDVIRINEMLFGTGKTEDDQGIDMKHRAYDTASILEILRYQYNNQLNNKETTERFGLSKNTLAKWKKAFEKEIREFG